MDVDETAVSLASQIMRYYESCEKKLPDGRIAPYLDVRGIPTIGWGNTRWQDGRSVSMADAPISQADADTLYDHFLGVFSKGVCDQLPNGTEANEAAAFISLSYNIGLPAFSGSTALREFLAGNKQAAGQGIEMWDKGGGVVLKGLQRRRRAERLVFDGTEVNAALRQAQAAFP
jgi:lysozyme